METEKKGRNPQGLEKVERTQRIEKDTPVATPCIWIADKKVYVETLRFTMSRKQKIIMGIDLYTIVMSAVLVTYLLMEKGMALNGWFVAIIGIILGVSSIGKIIVDFNNWLFTMNIYQNKMADRYREDVVAICNDFMTAGLKFAAEEVKKAVEVKTDGEGESANP